MKYPNFLIVGAAKSGSTTLYQILSSHPRVYMPANKEPNFFVANYQLQTNPECPSYKVDRRRMVFKESDYRCLFNDADNYDAVGEATVTYLYKPNVAIPEIKKYLGDPKILIILRNPISRALSQYGYCVEMGFEKLPLREALLKERSRLENNWSSIFAYADQGRYSKQIQSYIDNFTNVKVIIMEEFLSDEAEHMRGVFDFLSVESNIKLKIGQSYNVSGVPRFQWIHDFLVHKNNFRGLAKNVLLPVFGEKYLNLWSRRVRRLNQYKKIEYDEESRGYLESILSDEMRGVESILGRPIPSWRK